MSLASNNYAQQTADIVVIIAFAHNTIIFTIHMYHLVRHQIKYSVVSQMYWLSTITLFMMSFHRIGALSLSFGFYPKFISCTIYCNILSSTHFAVKTTLHILFIERLFITFKHSSHAFSNYYIYPSRIFILLNVSIMSILLFIFGQGIYLEVEDTCQAVYPFWLVLLGILLDFCIGIGICVVFTRRLMWLSATSCIEPHQRRSSLAMVQNTVIPWRLFNKFTVLTIFAVFTTFCSMILAYIFGLYRGWVSIDTMINSWCIVLMFSVYDKLYIRLCDQLQKITKLECFLICFGCNCCCCQVSNSYIDSNPKTTNANNVDVVRDDVEMKTVKVNEKEDKSKCLRPLQLMSE
eukprot:24503_1